MPDLLAVSHLIVTGSYIFIPLQFCLSLSKSPHRHNMPWRLIVCLILVAFFFFLCGTAHFLLAIGKGTTVLFTYIQCGNALVSATTAFYLIPLIPDMFTLLDTAVNNLQNETKESKSKLFTFMAFLCHEIRNPLFAITSSAECLQDTSLTQEQMEEVSSIGDSSLLMLRLVNDVLDLSKLDSGKLQLECREFDLHALLKRLGENMARQVRRKHQGAVQMNCILGKTVPQFVLGDSVRILQIIYNLLSNSCKFTSKGIIELKIEAMELTSQVWEPDEGASDGYTVTMSNHRPVAMFASESAATAKNECQDKENDDEEAQVFSMALLSHNSLCHPKHEEDLQGERKIVLSIKVKDTGIGIPRERLEDIFEPYTQAKLSDFRQHGGTGLGLSIISSLTKTMGGTISVTSRPGEGAQFHLKLPVKLPDDNIHHTGATASDKTSQSQISSDSMNYVGELLPNDQEQVPDNFLKCQRMPRLSSHHLVAAEAELEGAQTNPANAMIGTARLPPKAPTSATPLFSITPATMNASLASDMMDMSSISCSARTEMTNSRRNKSFDLPPNDCVVLVVDDNSVNRKILGKMLKTFGIEHSMACNGQEAVNALMDSRNYPPKSLDRTLPRYGLVFMDISMPVMDGNTAIRTIREANISVPIVALSANVLSQERDRTIGLGADAFHTKPILRNDLVDLCEQYLLNDVSTTTPASDSTKHTRNASDSPLAPLPGTMSTYESFAISP